MVDEGNEQRRSLFGVPVWAWISGLAIGSVFGLLLFDNWAVKILFTLSIGTAFALAFAQTRQKR